MSMLSAQCDKLRELATRFDEIQVGATRAVRIPLDTGSVLREAADTIWQLRDDLQRANSAVQDAEHDESMAWDRVRKAEAENAQLRAARDTWAENDAKLRELVRDMWFWGYEGHMDSKSQEWQMKHIDGVLDRMREMGVEVEG